MKQRKKRKLKKAPIFACLTLFIVLFCIIIQMFFTPKWFDGNTQKTTKSDEGVHTQEKTGFNENEITKTIVVINE